MVNRHTAAAKVSTVANGNACIHEFVYKFIAEAALHVQVLQILQVATTSERSLGAVSGAPIISNNLSMAGAVA